MQLLLMIIMLDDMFDPMISQHKAVSDTFHNTRLSMMHLFTLCESVS